MRIKLNILAKTIKASMNKYQIIISRCLSTKVTNKSANVSRSESPSIGDIVMLETVVVDDNVMLVTCVGDVMLVTLGKGVGDNVSALVVVLLTNPI